MKFHKSSKTLILLKNLSPLTQLKETHVKTKFSSVLLQPSLAKKRKTSILTFMNSRLKYDIKGQIWCISMNVEFDQKTFENTFNRDESLQTNLVL